MSIERIAKQMRIGVGTVVRVMRANERDWGNKLCLHHQSCALEPAGDSQKRAWHNCFRVLRDQLRHLNGGYVIFEYELPREGGRCRPDAVVLIGNTVFVLEFKEY